MPSDPAQCCHDLWEHQFREALKARLLRWVLGVAYALRPKRASLVPRLLGMIVVYWLKPKQSRDRLPKDPVYYGQQGLIGLSNDLSVDTVIVRYRQGWFPLCHIGPMKWWSPSERAIIVPAAIRIDRNVRRLLRRGKFLVTFDEDFAGVIEACAAPRPGKTPLTWITPQVMRAFWDLHAAGYAHSVEVWDENCDLVAGLYGLAIGGVFFAESRFARVENASKVAVAVLHHHLAQWGFGIRDAKWISPHLASLGFRLVSREIFNGMLENLCSKPTRLGRWEIDETLDTPNWQSGCAGRLDDEVAQRPAVLKL